MIELERTSAAIAVISGSIQEKALDGLAASYLAQYLAVIMYSEMEEKVSTIVEEQFRKHSHCHVATFVTASLSDIIRRTPKSDIAKLLKRFGNEFKEQFNEKIDDRLITIYSNVIDARHDVGHKRGSTITIEDVVKGYEAAKHILAAISGCFPKQEDDVGAN